MGFSITMVLSIYLLAVMLTMFSFIGKVYSNVVYSWQREYQGDSSFDDDSNRNARRQVEEVHPCTFPPIPTTGAPAPARPEHRYTAILYTGNTSSQTCSAAITSSDTLVTSASCVGNFTDMPIIIVGSTTEFINRTGEQVYTARSILYNENYTPGVINQYDKAVVKIKLRNRRGIRFNNRIQPVCKPFAICWLRDVSNYTMTGHDLSVDGEAPLTTYTLTLMNNQNCSNMNLGFNITERMFCATKSPPGRSCNGFLGGPVLAITHDEYINIGVVSACLSDDIVIITDGIILGPADSPTCREQS